MFEQLRIRKQLEMNRRRLPRLGISPGVIDGDVQFEVSEIRAAVALGDVQGLGMRVTAIVKPGSLFETSHVDHKRVAVPLPNRVPEPGGIGILRERTAIGGKLPIQTEL